MARQVIPLLAKLGHRLRTNLFPTEHDKELQRWYFDDGDERLRYEYDLNSDSLVLDLGGYKGQWASDIYSRYNSNVMVFEPVSAFANAIEKRFSRNPKIKVFRTALGAANRQQTISLLEDGSSIFRPGSVKESVQVQDIAEFFGDHAIHEVDLMKVNIEGGEYELLPRLLQTKLVNRIKNIQVQFHNIARESASQMESICRGLAVTHRPTYQYRFVWENWVRHNVSHTGTP